MRAIARWRGCWVRTRTPCSGSSSTKAGRCANGAPGIRPRVQSLPSAASRPNERWATDMARVWCGEEHRWRALTVVMDCYTRELLGWRLSRTGNAKAAGAALEEALISRYGVLSRAQDDLTIRSDNGLVFCSRQYTRTVYCYRIKQEFIRPHTPQQNSMVERLIRSVKEQCLWLHNFDSIEEARRALTVIHRDNATSRHCRLRYSAFDHYLLHTCPFEVDTYRPLLTQSIKNRGVHHNNGQMLLVLAKEIRKSY